MQVGFPQKSAFGTLTATKILCPEYDSVGATVLFKRAGSERIVLGSVKTEFKSTNLRLRSNVEIEDETGVILGTDNSQHIDELGRIDAPLTSPADSFDVHFRPAMACSKSQSGTIVEISGEWDAGATDELYLWLANIIPFQMLQGTVRIDAISINFTSVGLPDFITNVQIGHFAEGLTAFIEDWGDPTDKGNGSTGNDDAVYTPAETLADQLPYVLKISAEIGDDSLKVYTIGIKYSLV